jgi:hypothetical protein
MRSGNSIPRFDGERADGKLLPCVHALCGFGMDKIWKWLSKRRFVKVILDRLYRNDRFFSKLY